MAIRISTEAVGSDFYEQGIIINIKTHAFLIKFCTDMKALNEDKQVHTHMENSGIKIP